MTRRDEQPMNDRLMPAGGEARLQRPTFRVAFVVALAAGIVSLGILGPHNSGSPGASATAPTAGTPTPALQTPTPLDPNAFAGNGLLQILPQPQDVRQSWLPTQISSDSMAVLGLRLFYVVATDRIESMEIGDQSSTRTAVTVPHCQTINQIAAAGHTLAYVVTTPVAKSGGVFGCAGPAQVAWSVNLLDLDTGRTRRVASGTRSAGTIDIAEFPVHLALSDNAYAFERPANAALSWGSTVEVHALDGRLLWSSPISPNVTQLTFEGGTLAALTESPPYVAGPILWLASAADPHLREVATPTGSASLSSDGNYLVFDASADATGGRSAQSSVWLVAATPQGGESPIRTSSGSTSSEPLHPVVAASGHGLVVAWLLTTSAGGVFPAFRFMSDRLAVEIPTVQEPIWLGLEGSTLVWVTESGDGWSTGVFATDLWKLEAPDLPAGRVPPAPSPY